MSAKGKTVSLSGYEIEEIARPLKEALAIVQCAEDSAVCVHPPCPAYIGTALNVVVALLSQVDSNMDGLLRQTDIDKEGEK